MATWPGSLPSMPRNGSFSMSPEDNVATWQPDAGRPLRRRRYTARRYLYGATVDLDEAQRDALIDFYTIMCQDGSLTFTMQDWVTGLVCTFSWIGAPEISHISKDSWQASIQIAREPS